ncbi:MAG: hypothetical protein J7559_08165 [Cohnella sp.]|nr:hypothetical protein [Cohnella sp.]
MSKLIKLVGMVSVISLVIGGCGDKAQNLSGTAPAATVSSPGSSFESTATNDIDPLPTEGSDGFEPIAAIQTSAESPDGQYVIETYGENQAVTAAGLFPAEGIRLVHKASDKQIWSKEGYYRQEFKWSPDSSQVSVYHEARIWGDTIIVNTTDGSELSIPGIEEVRGQWKGETTVSDIRSDPYFKVADWLDDTRVNVTFSWTGQKFETFSGNYVYDLPNERILDLNVHKTMEAEGKTLPVESLVAALPDRDIFLYGEENGANLHVGDRVYAYDWIYTTPRQIMPAMDVRDYDKDGREELFVNLNIGSGTGVAVDELHLVEIGENPVKDVVFQEKDYLKQLEQAGIGFRTVTESGELFGEIRIGNKTEKVSLKEYQTDDGKFIQDQISFSSIVRFASENGRLKATFGVGVFMENVASPFFIGYVNADIAYQAGKFTMSNFKFALYDE